MQTTDFEKCATAFDLKSVRENLIRFCAPTNRSFNIQVPHEKPYEVDGMVKDKVTYSVAGNKSDGTRHINQDNAKPDRGIRDVTLIGDIVTNSYNPSVEVQQDRRNPDRGIKTYTLHGDWRANKTDSSTHVNQEQRAPDKGIKDCVLTSNVNTTKTSTVVQLQDSERGPDRGVKLNLLQGNVNTNLNSNERCVTPIYNFIGNQKVVVQDRVRGTIKANVSGVENHALMHEKEYYLPAKTSRGGFVSEGYKPQLSR
jgi:hypothetical protein